MNRSAKIEWMDENVRTSLIQTESHAERRLLDGKNRHVRGHTVSFICRKTRLYDARDGCVFAAGKEMSYKMAPSQRMNDSEFQQRLQKYGG